MREIFPKFLENKKRQIKVDNDVGVELQPQTQEVMEDENIASKRFLGLFYGLILVVFSILFFRLFYLQIVSGAENRQKAEENRLRIRYTASPRGIVYDKNMIPLLKNVASFSIEIYPTDLPTKKPDRLVLYQKLSEILNIPVSQIESVEQKKNLDQSIILKDNLTQEEAILFESRAANLPATKVVKKPAREYLNPALAMSHILGYAGKVSDNDLKNHPELKITDIIGKSGVELSYDQYLRGEDGKQEVEVNSQGKVARVLDNTSGQPGNSLILSLDLGLQDQMAKSLLGQMDKAKVKSGLAVAINPQNGEILGLVSLPAYDDNLFARGIKKEEYDQLLKDPYKPLFNRVISALYEPGSTVKPLVAAGALQDGVITEKTTISDPGVISIVNQYNSAITYNYPDWKPGGHGSVNVYKAIEQSCDIFFYAVGGGWQNIKGLGVDRLNKWYAKFGMGQKTGIDIPGEEEGFIPTPEWKEKVKKESWYQGDTYHIAIGQGDLTVTPLQLLNYTVAMANGGTFYKPHLVSKIQTSDGQMIKTIEPEVITKDVVSKENLAISREGMKLVAQSGTGRQLSDLPVSSAGKTGTAQNPQGEPHSWFISFAPYDNPQIATVVMVENAGEGNEYALPVTKEILNYYFTRPQK